MHASPDKIHADEQDTAIHEREVLVPLGLASDGEAIRPVLVES